VNNGMNRMSRRQVSQIHVAEKIIRRDSPSSAEECSRSDDKGVVQQAGKVLLPR